MADYPFYDKQPGPERREKLNELYAVWEAAIGGIVKGDAGWSPLIRAVTDANRVVLQLYDWTGGQGTKPTQTGYLGASGYVSDISLAIDFRGPAGIQGADGPPNTLSIGTVIGGASADATITGTAPNQTLNLVLPKGDTGDPGDAATIAIGTVTTGPAGSAATVTNSGTSSAAVFDFTIPRGQDGSGAGDMLKADYDSVGDGVVNAARAAPWTGITGKPAVIAAGATSADARTVIDAVSSGELNTGLNDKVDKIAGKGLSTEDFTTAEKTKLAGIATGATANQSDSYLLNRANHTGQQAISTVTGLQTALDSKQATLVSGTNIKTVNGESLLGSGNIVVSGGSSKSLRYYGTATTLTVPSGVSSIRFYIGGKGGNGGSTPTAGIGGASGGGGGGFAFGDIAVSAGDEIVYTQTAGVSRLALNEVQVAQANPGGDGSVTTTTGAGNAAPGGVGGTASIAGTVTNGGAHSGGDGGSQSIVGTTSGTSRTSGGGSCGSPLGNGFAGGSSATNNCGGGGGGIGGEGSAVGGGGAGEPAGTNYGGGSAPLGRSRGISNAFSDPLLISAVFPRTFFVSNNTSGGPGAGGVGTTTAFPGAGGDFAGGGGGIQSGGAGGLMGGGGGGNSGSPGSGGPGGGGGGSANGLGGGLGGNAFLILYY